MKRKYTFSIIMFILNPARNACYKLEFIDSMDKGVACSKLMHLL